MPIKSVLFRVDANALIGWGHFYRSLALALMLKNDFKISFAISDPPGQIRDILSKHNISILELPDLDYTSPDERNGREFEFDLPGQLAPYDIVVTDGYWFGEKYRRGLRREDVKIAVIEDAGEGRYDADLIINHAPGLKKNQYSTPAGSLLALGPDYAMLRPAFLEKAEGRDFKSDSGDQAFICFGGADIEGLAFHTTRKVLENSTHSVKLIASSAHPAIGDAMKLKERYPDRLTLKSNLSEFEMSEVISNSSLGIIPASGLLYECIACRLPVITGYYAENQKRIYAGIENADVSLPVGNLRNISLKSILPKITAATRKKIRDNQSRFIDGRSKERFRELFKLITDA